MRTLKPLFAPAVLAIAMAGVTAGAVHLWPLAGDDAIAAPRTNAEVDHDIKKYVCEKLEDFSASVTVVKQDQRELRKISKDIGTAYAIPNITMRYKEPNMVRMEGSTQGTKVTYILNGTKQIVMLNGFKKTNDLGKSPGKRKSLMDVGLISDFYLTYMNARYMRESTVDGTPCALFEMTYKDKDEDSSHHNIYVDPVTRTVRKRESYSQEGKLQAIYFYKKVEKVDGVWVPTEIEVQNTDRIIAGIMEYKNIKVNRGIPDSVFKP